MFKITIKGRNGGEVLMEQETSLLMAAAKGGLDVTHRCGGHARCGTCIATVEEGAENLSPVGLTEGRILAIVKAAPDQRLCCQAWAKGDVTVRVR
jgi:ferredoxin